MTPGAQRVAADAVGESELAAGANLFLTAGVTRLAVETTSHQRRISSNPRPRAWISPGSPIRLHGNLA
jgi:hypothetical protein